MELIFGTNGVELVKENGNWEMKSGFGFSPVQSLVASVGACGMYVFTAILTKSGIEHEIIKTTLAFEVDESTRVKPIKTITIDYHITVDASDKDKVERFVHLVPKNCPVMQSLNSNIEVIENIIYL